MPTPTPTPDPKTLEQENAQLRKELETYKQAESRAWDRRKFVLRHLGGFFLLGPQLKGSVEKILGGDTSKSTIADTLIAVLYRFTRIGVFAVIVALVPIVLLWQQNRLLDRQNYRLDQQTALLEADRRSAVILESGNVLDAISRELENPENMKRRLSDPLIGRIIALSKNMKPYKFLDPDTDRLSDQSLSPERGHLLIALYEAKLDTNTYLRIFAGGFFQKADLSNANLKRAILHGAKLNGAKLDGADLLEADITEANLSEANLSQSILSGAILSGSELEDADLSEANLIKVKLDGANLVRANLSKAKLFKANLRYAYLESSNFEGAELVGAELFFAYTLKTNFSNAYFSGVTKIREKGDSLNSDLNNNSSIFDLDKSQDGYKLFRIPEGPILEDMKSSNYVIYDSAKATTLNKKNYENVLTEEQLNSIKWMEVEEMIRYIEKNK